MPSRMNPNSNNFVVDVIEEDVKRGRYSRPICTRFPPEPNGYMHIGHAKAAMVGYQLAKTFHGKFNLRFDDTNPSKEDVKFVDSMKNDMEWLLGEPMHDRVFFASGYFQQLYDCAVKLIELGFAYVESLTAEEIKTYRGDFYVPGKPSPWRDRPIPENISLFEGMKNGQYLPGNFTLRAKIDPASANMNLRDPIIYRIMDFPHPNAKGWNIYPLYDFAHPLCDAFEGVTHSTCGEEFSDHRPLYNWFLEKLEIFEPPRQIEFAEVAISKTILSKRYLRQIVEGNHVMGWDDPRMPTISALRRRGYPAISIRNFCEGLGVSKGSPGTVDIAALEFYVRKELNKSAQRVMAVQSPVLLEIENYPEGVTENFEVMKMPGDASFGVRRVQFSKLLYIDEDDFMEDPSSNFNRLAPGREVRLRNAYNIKCLRVIKNPSTGRVEKIIATYDPDSRNLNANKGKRKGSAIHWVDSGSAISITIRSFGALFNDDAIKHDGKSPIISYLNSDSLVELSSAVAESSVTDSEPGDMFQFERIGYFCVDLDSTASKLIFNRTVGLREDREKSK
jgi:glutaminyl-tRNA synthetase